MLKALLIADKNARIGSYPGNIPAALVEVLGAPLLARIAEHLRQAGAQEVVVVTDIEVAKVERVSGVRFVNTQTEELWRVGERTFAELETAVMRGVIIARADQYAEVNWKSVLAHHLHFRNRATRVWCGDDACDLYLVSPGRRNEAASIMRHRLTDTRSAGVPYKTSPDEYANLLRDCNELRKLSQDALYRVNQIVPRGEEVRPGVWVGEKARIEKSARIVAPAYVGAYARVHGGAVITRGSVIEHHISVDCDSVVENSWIQPYTAVGAALDVTDSIVDGERMLHLKRKVSLQRFDPKLLRERRESAVLRTVQAAAALMTYLPAAILDSASNRRVTQCGSRRFEDISGAAPRSSEDMAKLAPGLAVMRRYGNE